MPNEPNPPPRVTPPPDPLPTQWARAIANATWHDLKHQRWRTYRDTRPDAPTGNPRTGRDHVTSSGFRGPNTPAVGTIETGRRTVIETVLYPEHAPDHQPHALRLHHNHYLATLQAAPDEQRLALLTALKLATCRQPFELTTNRHNTTMLRRNSHDATITPPAALALEAIASVTLHEPITHEQMIEHLLITDDDIDATTVFAITERARRAEREQPEPPEPAAKSRDDV